ncbi:MAG: hypothetical protein ACYDCL_22845 [Myxococcales bacterium]
MADSENATIRSADGVFQPVVGFRHAGEAKWLKQELIGSGDAYSATLPGATVTSDLEYYLEAYDNDGNGPGRAGGPDAPFHVTVTAAPQAASPAASVAAPPPKPAPAAATAEAKPQTSGAWLPIVGWAAGGAGLVALGIGVAFSVVSSGDTAQANADSSGFKAQQDQAAAASASSTAIPFYVGGAVLVATGAVLLILHYVQGPAAPPHQRRGHCR